MTEILVEMRRPSVPMSGDLAQALMKDETLQSSTGGFPPPWLSKVESLLAMTGDARRDALVIFSHQLAWIFGHACCATNRVRTARQSG
jgi:hypothetical protein